MERAVFELCDVSPVLLYPVFLVAVFSTLRPIFSKRYCCMLAILRAADL
jgi:hypothetical protein